MTASAPQPVLEARDLHTYYGGAHILADLSFALNDGEVVVLLGRNGAGKTTTMKSVMGLVRMRAGTVHLEGADITGREPHVIARAGMGYVPEDRRIFGDLTVMENLEVGRQAGTARCAGLDAGAPVRDVPQPGRDAHPGRPGG